MEFTRLGLWLSRKGSEQIFTRFCPRDARRAEVTTATFQEGEQEAEGALVMKQALPYKRRRRMGHDVC